ncbi:MAG: low-specificity L-threonine aldolase [Chloroflexi bacterium]|jgi:threonine aldolase|nr:low-specificity L-threonine aldolase [Chloroflexota bacterium]MBT4003934.1 low-specificity L-threonine aldolase [Chloroflexota bacterium]MBT4305760.1 low-specificity L-threonine aldolase [Chloroflexota bacterium]MBT4533584.1 low-specificity L-threonine aldolase [Chloroflexota bacterium]MBT4681773.1 low-specificity L-threonine aldolase [Chloroflexota bacterium]
METLDFRSDTVTKPTPEMWEAIAKAEVGDDVYGEDPSINKLQELSAHMLGKEAALFVPTGTMGNLIAMLVHCQRGDEMIVGNLAHAYLSEAGGMAALGGIFPNVLVNQTDGTLLLDDIQAGIKPDDNHFAITRMITLENTHNRCGGVSLSTDYVNSVANIAKQHGLKFHIDGARIFNAAVDQGKDVKELLAGADSVTFCLSKGLAAPVGSVLCGSKEFIYKAQRARKQLGGGMRQAGVVASAGIVALEKMTGRLEKDHLRAKNLAMGLEKIEGLNLLINNTNMVYFDLDHEINLTIEEFISESAKLGLLFGYEGGRQFRLVTHVDITDLMVENAIEILKKLVEENH